MDRKNNLNFSVVFYEFIQRLIFWCFSVSLSKYFFKTKYFEDTSNVSHAVKCNMKAGELLRTLCCFQLKVSRVTMYSRSILFSISKTEFPNYASLCRHSQYISLWLIVSDKERKKTLCNLFRSDTCRYNAVFQTHIYSILFQISQYAPLP